MVNILFCGNSLVFDGILTTTLSMLLRTTSKEPFCIYLFTMDKTELKDSFTPISEDQKILLENTVKKYNSENQVIKFDVTELYNQEFKGCPNEKAYCSPYTLIRLLASLIPSIPDKILYLDCDLMFNRDIHLLYDYDIDNYEYAASNDHYGKYLIRPTYINAGVLLLNMKLIRQNHLMEKARGFLKKKKFLFADQTALIKSTTKRKLLPQKFNDQKFLHKHTVIRHFSKRLFYLPYPHTENIKQWNIAKVHEKFHYHQFDDIYEVYESIKKQEATK
ncbi:MAG: glycosyltransferase [Bacilli bacterium]